MVFKRMPKSLPIVIFCGFVIPIIWFICARENEEIFEEFVYETFEIVSNYTTSELQTIETAKECFQVNSDDLEIEFLDDIMEADEKPRPDTSIFFHVTSCTITGRVILNARQACSIESAAKWNPNRDVYVLFASPVGFVPNEPIPHIVSTLLTYPNIHLRNLNLYTYSIDTPAEDWIRSDKIFLSEFLETHVSDYLRFLTLYKFGGISFDLDVIIQKNLDNLPPNFAGAMTIGVLGFGTDEIGHELTEIAVRENIDQFRPELLVHSGSGVITRILQSICYEADLTNQPPELCWGLKVFSLNTFYEIPHGEQSLEPMNVNKTLELVKDSIAVHDLSQQKIIKSAPISVYGILARNNCPSVFGSSGFYF